MQPLRLSVIVVAYNMERELPRTLRSLGPTMQLRIAPEDYEILVVDNGSSPPVDIRAYSAWCRNVEIMRIENPRISPAGAINKALRRARGQLIGVMIDGARIASPGLLANALAAARLCPRPVIASLGFHLGPEVQMQSVAKGYNQQVEDGLLANARWHEDGYRLFDISVFAGSSAAGWFRPVSESNALFLHAADWQELGGFDEGFAAAGGGLVNLDTYVRACELPDSQLIVLLGEGTFHQVHGGVATNASTSPWSEFHAEYMRLRGKEFCMPVAEPWYFGQVRPQALDSIARSAEMARPTR
ncbi:MAG TPA: glycosyltransferase family A protein [Pirellulales bacterium]|nr:glycosyltransferase family A protein [Pirellulales bacterium]